MSQRQVAVVQAGSSVFDTPRTLERMRAWCEQAGATGAELVVFPEAYIGGYPKGLDFGARIGSRSAAGREDFLRYSKAAITLDGPEVRVVGEFAELMRATLVTGAIEREGGTLYCSVLCFGPDGRLIGHRRKLVPTASERLVWGSGDGSTLQAFETPAGRLAAAICWENYMPMLRTSFYAQSIDIWCAPTVDERDIWQSSMRHLAYEGRCFVLSACQYLTRDDYPSDFDHIPEAPDGGALIKGGSVIVSPLGDVLAGPLRGQEGVISATLDLDDIARGKYDLDVTGHYARPDIFTLRVNRAVQRAVEVDNQQQPERS
ncbi:MAG: carbon-nitrogen hydrolase family protein [Acidobacteria bacterium]|nr:carbon-nitrogen hydrolase family protein [Acidobacteriota bacterium]